MVTSDPLPSLIKFISRQPDIARDTTFLAVPHRKRVLGGWNTDNICHSVRGHLGKI